MSKPSGGYTSPSSIIAICVVLPVLSIVAIALRFYTRKRNKNALKLDDWFVKKRVMKHFRLLTTTGYYCQRWSDVWAHDHESLSDTE